MFPSKGFGLGIVGLLTALLAWPALFSTLAPYDDEGYCMMTLRTFAQGERLYGATHTQYGPAYYFLTSPIHEWLHWPLTQTGVRVKTLLAWCLAAMLTYLFVMRAQPASSPFAAIGTAIVVILHLDKMALEPGHPQEMILLGSLFSMLLISTRTHVGGSISQTRWFAAGIMAAIIGFTKLNCGMVLAVAMIVSAFMGSPQFSRLRFGIAVLVALPAMLIAWMARSDLGTVAWALWIALCAGMAVLRFAHDSALTDAQFADTGDKLGPADSPDPNRTWIAVVFGGLLTSLALVCLSISSGITSSELWFGLIGQHADFGSDFFKPIPGDFGCALGVLSVALLFWVKTTGHFQRRSMLTVAGLAIMCIAWTALEPLQHGLKPRGAGAFMVWFLPGWLGLVYRSQSNERFAVLLGILSPLIAFPVSGTQVAIGTIPGLVLFGVAFSRTIQVGYDDWASKNLLVSPFTPPVSPFSPPVSPFSPPVSPFSPRTMREVLQSLFALDGRQSKHLLVSPFTPPVSPFSPRTMREVLQSLFALDGRQSKHLSSSPATFAEQTATLSEQSATLSQQSATRFVGEAISGARFLSAVICLFIAATFSHWYRYANSVPLGLPGSDGMRLSQSVVDEQRAIVEAVKASHSETLVFEGHNNNRFYFWTNTKPATAANPTFWPRMLNESERKKLEERLARPGRFCVVRVPHYERFYDERTGAIQEQLRNQWERTSTIGDWDVGVIDLRKATESDQNR